MSEGRLFESGSGLAKAFDLLVQKEEAAGRGPVPSLDELEERVGKLIQRGDEILYNRYGIGQKPNLPNSEQPSPSGDRLVIDERGLRLEVNDQGLLQIEKPGGGKSQLSLQAKIPSYSPDRLVEISDLSKGINVELGDETMDITAPVPVGKRATLGLRQRLIINKDQSYVLTIAEDGYSRELIRETVRPSISITHNQEDGQVVIEGGLIKGEGELWLLDNQPGDSKVVIEMKNKKAFVDGKKVKGTHQAIKIGEETVHLIVEKEDFKFLNQVVYEARYPHGKEAAEKKDWNVPVGEWFADAPKGLKKFWEQGIKPRGWKDAISLLARFISDSGVPGGWMAGLVLMTANLGLVVTKEWRTMDKLDKELYAFLNSSDNASSNPFGLSAEDVDQYRNGDGDFNNLIFKAYWKQTSFGRLSKDNTKTGLNQKERNWALALGIGSGSLFLGLSEALARLIPGGSLGKLFLNRALIGYVAPELVALFGKKALFGKEPAKQEQAKEWLGLTLGAMSATITASAAIMFAGEGAAGLINQLEQRMAAVAAEATPTPTPAAPSPTQEPAATAPSTETVAPTQPPTAEPTATLEWQWAPGMPVDKDLLQNAAESNHGWGVDIDHDGKADFQAFWLDRNAGPDVIVDADQNHFIRTGDNFFLDADKNGMIDQNEARGWWELKDINPSLDHLNTVPQSEAPNLPGRIDGLMDIDAADITKTGTAHLAMPRPVRVETEPLQPRLDLNGDQVADLVRDNQGWFADNNYDGHFTKEADSRISELKFDQSNWQIDKAVYEDGSMWLRSDDGELVGVMSNGRRITLDDSSGTSRLQAQMHHENPAWSPWQVGRQAVINPENLDIPAAPATPITLPQPIPEQVIETEHGSWHQPRGGGQEWGIKSSGDRLILGPAGGVQGVLAQQLHLNHQALTPDDAAVIAHRVALDNKEAFAGPIGDGSRVTNAMTTASVDDSLNFHINVVQAERFLESHADWLKNNHFDLSDKERFEVAKLAAPHWADWDDDDEIKAGLLNLIPGVEAQYD